MTKNELLALVPTVRDALSVAQLSEDRDRFDAILGDLLGAHVL
jgi:hypothetical protein